MIIKLNITNTENIGDLDQDQLAAIEEIVEALLQTGSLTGVKAGTTMINFDGNGVFTSIETKYRPWIRRLGGKPNS